MPLEDARKLTPWQIRHIYFRRRDERGTLVPEGKVETVSEEDEFVRRWMRWGLTRKMALRRWAAEQKG